MMRIEIVTDTFPPDVNGVAMTLDRLSKGLKELGHYVHVIHTGEQKEVGQTSKKSFVLPGYKEVRVGLPSPIRLRQRWKRKRPDAVYVATESPLGVSAIKAARELGVPVIAGFHTNFHQYLNTYFLKGIDRPAMGYLKHVHSKVDMTLAPSADVQEMLEREGFENVQVLGRGADTTLFHPKKRNEALRKQLGAEAGAPIVLLVGRVSAEKNLEFGLKMVESMHSVRADVQAVVVGDGPSRESLQKQFPAAHFVGAKEGDELAEYYASADILLFPSETETFGNVLLEGMASGLVTVSYNYAASSIHVKDGKNGYHAEVGNEASFEQKAHEAFRNFENASLRNAARESLKDLSWSSVVKKFEGYLQQVVKDKASLSRRVKKRSKIQLRSLFLSDLHLGTYDAKTREVINVLKAVECDRIYLNGDIIDGWALKRGSKWRKSHTKVLRVLLRKMEKKGTEIIYLRGNHDDFLEKVLPLDIGELKVLKEYVHESVDEKRYLVVHGDGFDSVSTNHKWVANVGAVGYDFLLKVNRLYNIYRTWRGKEYYSLSKAVKANVKSAVSFVDNYEEKLESLAVARQCDGIICGHIHTPADKMINNTHYLNSGDWVETMSCIFEHHDGEMEVVHYPDFLDRVELEEDPPEAPDSMDEASPLEVLAENPALLASFTGQSAAS